MSWADFYLLCFLVGFALSLISVLAGGAHLHIPHVHFDGLHVHVHGPHAGAGAGEGISIFNIGTIAAFLAWFGGTGFLLERYYSVWFLLALGIATLSGLGGAAVVFLFVAKVLVSREENLDPADYDMVGVLGHVSLPIRAGGTGEIIFTQEGVRHSAGARSETNAAIPKGAEVVVTRYERGIAYVRRWEELAAEEGR